MPSNTSDASSSDASSSDSALAGENFEKPHSLVDYLAFWRSFQDDEAKKIDNGFMRQALLSGVLVALLCSFVGVYVVLKRIVFVSVALAEMSSAGIALGLLLNTARLPPIWCAGFLTLLGVVLFSVHWTPRRVPRESYIGIMYAVAVAAGILLIAKSAQGEGHMLTLLQGDILTVAPAEVRQMMVAFALVALVHAVFHKEFVLVSFDRDQAATLGFRAAWWDFLLFLTIGIVISFSIRAVGILLSTALLILPAVMALLLTRRLRHAFVVAPLVAVLPVPFGLHFSLLRDLPPSALTVALGFGLLVPAMLYSAIKK